MKRWVLILIVFINVFYLFGCASNTSGEINSKEVNISAAASLKDAMEEIKTNFQKRENIKIALNLAASGTLQKQIEEGAPTDLFISAGIKQMDVLEDKDLIDKDSRMDLLNNKLVLIVAQEYKDKIKSVEDLIQLDGKISIGEPGLVPAGYYAKESLISMNLWEKLKDRMVLAKDVKQVLAYVERGEAGAGIVYASDAVQIKDSVLVETLDEKTHSPIIYPVAIVADGKNKNEAAIFFEYILSEEAKKVFEKYGFNLK